MRVLVTGGAGYIGTHVVEALVQRGHVVTVFDNFSNSDMAHVHPSANLAIGDVTIFHDLQVAIEEMDEVDAIIHLAGKIEVGESVKYPMLFSRANVLGTCNVVRACEFNAIPMLLYASSAAVYKSADHEFTEDSEKFPESPYAQTKLMGEELVESSNLSSCIFRFFNAAGATPVRGFGERHNPETHLIPLALQACIRGTHLKIFGNDYETPDGTCVRDYVHVADIGQAFALALEKMADEETVKWVFNLGSGCGNTVLEVVRMVERVMKRGVDVRYFSRREGDVARLVSDPTEAKGTLGWTPKSSKLMKIVQDAADFAML